MNAEFNHPKKYWIILILTSVLNTNKSIKKGVSKNFEHFQTGSFSAKLEKYMKICGTGQFFERNYTFFAERFNDLRKHTFQGTIFLMLRKNSNNIFTY